MLVLIGSYWPIGVLASCNPVVNEINQRQLLDSLYSGPSAYMGVQYACMFHYACSCTENLLHSTLDKRNHPVCFPTNHAYRANYLNLKTTGPAKNRYEANFSKPYTDDVLRPYQKFSQKCLEIKSRNHSSFFRCILPPN